MKLLSLNYSLVLLLLLEGHPDSISVILVSSINSVLRFIKDVLLFNSLCVYMNIRENLVGEYLSTSNHLQKIEIMNQIFSVYPFLVIFLEKLTDES